MDTQLKASLLCICLPCVIGNMHTRMDPLFLSAVLTEWKLAARCCDPLMEAMKTFPRDSVVFSWAAYALCQLATSHSKKS